MTAQPGLSLLGWAASTWAPAPPTLSSPLVVLLGETGCSCPCLSPGGQPGPEQALLSRAPHLCPASPSRLGNTRIPTSPGPPTPWPTDAACPTVHRVRVTPYGSRFEGRRRVALYGWAGAMWGCFQFEISNLKSPEQGLPGVEGWAGWTPSQRFKIPG